MIGVVANPSEHAILREFFQLFKTPWEFYRRGVNYDVLLAIGDEQLPSEGAALVILYAGQKLRWDAEKGIEVTAESKPAWAEFEQSRFPLYGDSVALGRETVRIVHDSGRTVVRIGYDLTAEIRALLTTGQPAANALTPTLELHIAVLRELIVRHGIDLLEVPPVPEGCSFIACLTHDVDHPRLRNHRFDHTMAGFLYRAVVGSVIDAVRGRAPWRNVVTNWWAALKLPFVHLGLAKDFWYQLDRYMAMEQGASSSFFVIPFRKHAGRTREGSAPAARGAGYGAADIADCLQTLSSAGCEIALHGLDAWMDSSCAEKELTEVAHVAGRRTGDEVGVRMHWLYFDEQSPAMLEQAGASYDSTVGYNETVGYRAGTTQAYKPLGCHQLLELPLHVMDTALFYPSYLHLSPGEASTRIGEMVENAVRFGGVVTFNWHDRSMAPERLWGDTYREAIAECKSRGAWLCNAAQAVSWFRHRRAIVCEGARWDTHHLPALPVPADPQLPALKVRVHQARTIHNAPTLAAPSAV